MIIRVVAFGRYAEDRSLVVGNDVAIYFARVQKSNAAKND